MRWKKIEISLFSIHNACGYTSPPSSVGSLSSRRSLSSAVRTLLARRSNAIIIAKNKVLRGEFFERILGKLSFKKVFPEK